MVVCYSRQYVYTVVTPTFTYTCILLGGHIHFHFLPLLSSLPTPLPFHLSPCFQHRTVYVHLSVVMYLYIHLQVLVGTVSAKIAPRLKCYKNASRLNRYNFPTDNAIDFLFSTLHTTPFHYEVLKIGSRKRYPLGSYSDSNAMHFYNILTVGQFSRKLSQFSKL